MRVNHVYCMLSKSLVWIALQVCQRAEKEYSPWPFADPVSTCLLNLITTDSESSHYKFTKVSGAEILRIINVKEDFLITGNFVLGVLPEKGNEINCLQDLLKFNSKGS